MDLKPNAGNLLNEVLVEILHYAIPSGTQKDRSRIPPTTLPGRWAPLPFTRVCQHWRNVVLSSPTLWSTLALAIVSTTIAHDVCDAQRALSIWLKHSGNVPLILTMDFYEIDESTLRDIWDELSAAGVEGFISRCRKLEIVTHPQRLPIPEVFYQQVGTARDLEELVLRVGARPEDTQAAYAVLSRNLKPADSLAVPCHGGLRTLILWCSVSSSALVLLLSRFPSLEIASLGLCIDSDGQIEDVERNPSQSSRTICMPHLHSLSIRFDFSSSHSPHRTRVESYGPFQHALLPTINHLEINLGYAAESRLLDAEAVICGIASSIRRAHARLQWLYLSIGVHAPGDQIRGLLQALPSSPGVEFKIFSFPCAVDVFDAFTYHAEESRPTRNVIFPELRKLIVDVFNFGCTAADPTDVGNSLTNLAVSRWDVPVARGRNASATESETNENSAGALRPGGHGVERLRCIQIEQPSPLQSIKEKMLEDSACRRIIEEGFELEEFWYS